MYPCRTNNTRLTIRGNIFSGAMGMPRLASRRLGRTPACSRRRHLRECDRVSHVDAHCQAAASRAAPSNTSSVPSQEQLLLWRVTIRVLPSSDSGLFGHRPTAPSMPGVGRRCPRCSRQRELAVHMQVVDGDETVVLIHQQSVRCSKPCVIGGPPVLPKYALRVKLAALVVEAMRSARGRRLRRCGRSLSHRERSVIEGGCRMPAES